MEKPYPPTPKKRVAKLHDPTYPRICVGPRSVRVCVTCHRSSSFIRTPGRRLRLLIARTTILTVRVAQHDDRKGRII